VVRVTTSERFGHLFILGCIALGIICIQALWTLIPSQLSTQFSLINSLLILFAALGLFFSVIIVGAFIYQLDKAAGRIKKPNRLFERIIGEGE